MIIKILGGLRKEFLSIQGRMGRSQYIGGIILIHILPLFIAMIPVMISDKFKDEIFLPDIINTILSGVSAILILGAILFHLVGLININTKRSHDLGYTGWIQIIPFCIFFLLFVRGTIGENRFGIDPIQEQEDWIKDIKSGKKPIKKLKTKN